MARSRILKTDEEGLNALAPDRTERQRHPVFAEESLQSFGRVNIGPDRGRAPVPVRRLSRQVSIAWRRPRPGPDGASVIVALVLVLVVKPADSQTL